MKDENGVEGVKLRVNDIEIQINNNEIKLYLINLLRLLNILLIILNRFIYFLISLYSIKYKII